MNLSRIVLQFNNNMLQHLTNDNNRRSITYICSGSWADSDNCGRLNFGLCFLWNQNTAFRLRLSGHSFNQHTVEQGDKTFETTSLKKKQISLTF